MNWKKLYILAAVLFITVVFVSLHDEVELHLLHADHVFHFIKFEMFSRQGIADYEELGGIPFVLLIPPTVIPLLLLTKIMSSEIAYFLSYYVILAAAYVVSRKIILGKEDDVLLVMLTPLSLYLYFYMGRFLELIAHLPLLMLLFYMDKGKNKWISTGLFTMGFLSHQPTALFYTPILFFKAINKKKISQIIPCVIPVLIWNAFYIPLTKGLAIWTTSRVEYIYRVVEMSLETISGEMAILIIAGIMTIIMASLPFLGKESLYALPSFFIVIALLFVYMINPSLLKYAFGWNQVIIGTVIPVYTYLILKKSPKLWVIFALLTLPMSVAPKFDTAKFEGDLAYLDEINETYTTSLFPGDLGNLRTIIQHYLAYKGVPTIYMTTWEFNNPNELYYYPESCKELNIDAKYVIVPKKEQWVTKCGNYTETPNFIIVKLL